MWRPSTAQYPPRTPSGGRPFTPSGTSKPIASGSSPIGHQSRSYSSGRQNHMNQGQKSPSQPHTQSNPASSPYRNDQGHNSASNRPHYANQGQRPAFHRSPSQPRANYGSSYRPRSQSPGLNNSQHRSKSVDRHQPRFARGQSPRDLGAIMADIPGIGLAQSQVAGMIPTGMIPEVVTDIDKIMVRAGALLWGDKADVPSAGETCATQENTVHFPRINVHVTNATSVRPHCTTVRLLIVFFRNCPTLHRQTSSI